MGNAPQGLSDAKLNEQLQHLQNMPVKPVKTQQDAQRHFIEHGLPLLNEKIQISKNCQVSINFQITETELNQQKPPLNAAIIIGNNSIAFASIYAVQYGVNLQMPGFDEYAMTIIMHDFKPHFKNNKPHCQKDVTINYENPVLLRKYVLALSFLARLHRTLYKEEYNKFPKQNKLCKKIRSYQLSARSFNWCIQEYKLLMNHPENMAIQEFCDMLDGLCVFKTKQQYEQYTTEQEEAPTMLLKLHEGCAFNPKLHDRIPVFMLDQLKTLLKSILFDGEPEVKQCMEILTRVQQWAEQERFHMGQQDSLNIQMIQQALNMFRTQKMQLEQHKSPQNKKEIELEVKQLLEETVGCYLDVDENNIDDQLLQLQQEVENEKQAVQINKTVQQVQQTQPAKTANKQHQDALDDLI